MTGARWFGADPRNAHIFGYRTFPVQLKPGIDPGVVTETRCRAMATNDQTGTERTDTIKRFEGFDARFGTDADELYVELQAGRPAYIRVREGDYVQEGDAFHREWLGVSSPALETWEVVEITPEEVRGEHVETGAPTVWDRADLEKGLAVGRYSTNLTDFEMVSVYEAGAWSSDDEPYVSVVAYGDNGLKYGRRYRFTAPESNTLELWRTDEPRQGFTDTQAERFDRRVRAALEDDGYTVEP